MLWSHRGSYLLYVAIPRSRTTLARPPRAACLDVAPSTRSRRSAGDAPSPAPPAPDACSMRNASRFVAPAGTSTQARRRSRHACPTPAGHAVQHGAMCDVPKVPLYPDALNAAEHAAGMLHAAAVVRPCWITLVSRMAYTSSICECCMRASSWRKASVRSPPTHTSCPTNTSRPAHLSHRRIGALADQLLHADARLWCATSGRSRHHLDETAHVSKHLRDKGNQRRHQCRLIERAFSWSRRHAATQPHTSAPCTCNHTTALTTDLAPGRTHP